MAQNLERSSRMLFRHKNQNFLMFDLGAFDQTGRA